MNTEFGTFGGGCFWGVEKYFQDIPGVIDAVSGYAGGTWINPSYSDVCSGRSGHAEVVNVEFDTEIISLKELVHLFLRKYGETGTSNSLFPKSQYRSIILYRNDEQRQVIADVYNEIRERKKKNITTEIAPLDTFYKAEEYHQDHYGSCRAVSKTLSNLNK